MKRLIRACFAVPAALEIWRYRLFRALVGEQRAFRGLTERLANRTGASVCISEQLSTVGS